MRKCPNSKVGILSGGHEGPVYLFAELIHGGGQLTWYIWSLINSVGMSLSLLCRDKRLHLRLGLADNLINLLRFLATYNEP